MNVSDFIRKNANNNKKNTTFVYSFNRFESVIVVLSERRCFFVGAVNVDC